MSNPSHEKMKEATEVRAALTEPERIFVDPPTVQTIFRCECGSERSYTYGWDEIEEAVEKRREIPNKVPLHVCDECEPRDG